MSSNFRRSYSFDCEGSVSVPKRHSRYAGNTYYTGTGEHAKSITLPSNLYEDVPDHVNYRDSITVDLEVDGAPFDESVGRCCATVGSLNEHIDDLTGTMGGLNGGVRELTGGVCKLTGATVAAATGITGAKVASAEVIAGSLSKGFSKYIGYLIRERLTELEAQLPNTASTFKALSNNLENRKAVLGEDYERISSRYAKLFNKLNEELRRRLLELDRQAFENCAQIQDTIFTSPLGYILGQSVCAGAEQLQAADAIRVSRLKGSTATAMEVVKSYVKVLKRLSASVCGVLSDHKVARTQTISMPVVRMESDDVITQSSGNVRTFIPLWFEGTSDMGFGNTLADALAAKTTEKKSKAELEIVDSCFKNRFSNWAAAANDGGVADPRVTEKILMLWERSKTEMCN